MKTLCKNNILIAEDQMSAQLMYHYQMKALGYQYTIVENGAAAYQEWLTGDYSLVLTDIYMPKMDGIELTARIRGFGNHIRSVKRFVPIVAISANAVKEVVEQCISQGMNDCIAKPVPLIMLKAIIDEWLQVFSNNSLNKLEADKRAINIEALSEITGSNDADIINSIVSLFWNIIQKDMKILSVMVSNKDTQGLIEQSHSSKGAAASVCADTMTSTLSLLNKAAQNSDWDEAQRYMAELRNELINIEDFINSRMKTQDNWFV